MNNISSSCRKVNYVCTNGLAFDVLFLRKRTAKKKPSCFVSKNTSIIEMQVKNKCIK